MEAAMTEIRARLDTLTASIQKTNQDAMKLTTDTGTKFSDLDTAIKNLKEKLDDVIPAQIAATDQAATDLKTVVEQLNSRFIPMEQMVNKQKDFTKHAET